VPTREQQELRPPARRSKDVFRARNSSMAEAEAILTKSDANEETLIATGESLVRLAVLKDSPKRAS
jgi:hypothetical protein